MTDLERQNDVYMQPIKSPCGDLVALILRNEFREAGTHFFTERDSSQQLGFMRHPRGKIIDPHTHPEVPRAVRSTQEVLFIRRGRLRVDLYAAEGMYFESHILEAGDVILLASGGHGFEVLEEVEMIEVKQGPYAGDVDKVRFAPVDPQFITVQSHRTGEDDTGRIKGALGL